MTKYLTPETIAEIKRATASGEMRKHIAKRLGVGVKTVTHHSKDVEKPFEHRGKKRFLVGGSRVLSHREDFED